jgi:phosphate ABC transporter phosphate-binding protein
MKRVLLVAVLGSILCAAGCGGCGKRLNGGGSTFVFPMMSKWAAEYDKAKGVKVNYQSIGSGGGIAQMTAKTFDFGCTDGPMNEEQLQKCKDNGSEAVHIPLCMGAVVPAYNLPDFDKRVHFTGEALAKIYLGEWTSWKDLREIHPDNKGLPDKKIQVVHRSDGSGTTYIWVDYLSKVSEQWKDKVGVATSVNWPVGVGAKGNEGVSGQVGRTPGSIGYVELIYALQNDIKFGLVKNREGEFIEADLKSVTAAADAELKGIREDLRYSITNAKGKESYPISGTVWAVVYKKLPGEKGKMVVDFLRWVIHDGQQYCEALHYAKLPKGLVEKADKKLDGIEAGK